MLLLVTDTSGKNGSVGLVRAGEGAQPDSIEVIEEVPLAGGTFSAQLVPQIAGVLEKHRFQRRDVDAFIAVSGPGSFTGLRVGLAAIKALAEILRKPIVAVSLLEAVAIASNRDGKILAVLDAGRGEVYIGDYEVSRDTARLRSERLLMMNDLPSAARGLLVSTPDAGLAQTVRDAGWEANVVTINSETITRLGWRKMQAGGTLAPEQLEANYIRRSDAEIFSKPTASS